MQVEPRLSNIEYTDDSLIPIKSSTAGPATLTLLDELAFGGIFTVRGFSILYMYIDITVSTGMANPCYIMAEFSDSNSTTWCYHSTPIAPVSTPIPHFDRSYFGFPAVVGGYIIPISTCGGSYVRFRLLTTTAAAASRMTVDMLRGNIPFYSLARA